MVLRSLKSNCCLQLYVNGNSTESLRAIENLGRICRDSLPGSYEVPIVDVQDAPDAAEAGRIMWTPTLVKTFPRPLRRVVGDLADHPRVLRALDLPPALLGAGEKRRGGAGGGQDAHAKLLLSNPDGLLVLDAEGNVVLANQAATHLLGWAAHETSGRRLGIPWPDHETAAIRLPLGESRFAEARASVVEWGGRVCQLVSLRDVTSYVRAEQHATGLISELLANNQRLGRDASVDPLTGILNRRGLQDALLAELSRSRRGGALAVLLVDCDDFKGINDSHGYSVGDLVLRAVADVIASTLRPQDHIGRIGGDEFMVLLPGTRLAAAVQVGERVLRELSHKQLPVDLQDRRITVSIGASMAPPESETIEQVIAHSATPLKLAKTHGKHRVVIAKGGSAPSWEPVRLETETEQLLLDPSRLRVVAQGIVDLASGTLRACELLVRGPHGRLEQPRALFEVARNLGLDDALDLHCLGATLSACQQAPGLRHHINLLPSTILRQSEAVVTRLVERHEAMLPLCFEINEQEIVGDPSPLRAPCALLRRHGICVALDNVGFGRAALESLIMLQPNVIKIGTGLVSNVAEDSGRARDLRRLLAVARSLDVEIIAQGIESRTDLDALRDLGVTAGQGYYWGQPRPVAELFASYAALGVPISELPALDGSTSHASGEAVIPNLSIAPRSGL